VGFFSLSGRELLIWAGRMRKSMDIGKSAIEKKTLRTTRGAEKLAGLDIYTPVVVEEKPAWRTFVAMQEIRLD
jgi:hypothetical protein